MTIEDDFQNHLDADPEDHHTRLVFADWLQDRDDPRAEGYRYLGEKRMVPRHNKTNPPYQYSTVRGFDAKKKYPLACYEWWSLGHTRSEDIPTAARLPDAWLALLATEFPYLYPQGTKYVLKSCDYLTRREAEDAAAVVFPLWRSTKEFPSCPTSTPSSTP